jgi:phospholipid/cholesterol/gamma-HCH transport system substrate-binding protein
VETRSHIFLVSTVVAAAFAALVAFVMWITPDDPSKGRQYDILFSQSVSGLIENSAVTFAGIPVGRVQAVALVPSRPDLVRVRIAITENDLPIVEGTKAALKSDMVFGSAMIDLEAPDAPGRPIALNDDGIGVIAAKKPGFGDLTGDPSALLDRISRGTDLLMEMTSPEGQRQFSARLDASVQSTAAIAASSAQLDGRIALTRTTFREAATAASQFAARADAQERSLRTRGSAGIRQLRASSAAARESLEGLDQRLEGARAGVGTLSDSAAAFGSQARDLRESVATARKGIERVRSGGATSPTLPDYKPAD